MYKNPLSYILTFALAGSPAFSWHGPGYDIEPGDTGGVVEEPAPQGRFDDNCNAWKVSYDAQENALASAIEANDNAYNEWQDIADALEDKKEELENKKTECEQNPSAACSAEIASLESQVFNLTGQELVADGKKDAALAYMSGLSMTLDYLKEHACYDVHFPDGDGGSDR